MSTSEEYLASIGFDTSDVDKAVNQTVTLLGHMGNQFDELEKKTSRAERALLGTTKAQQGAARATASGVKSTKDQTSALETASRQTALYNQYLYDQDKALRRSAESAPQLRYALYDVASTALATSAAITGIGIASAVASASYESAFTNVERTLEPGSIAVERLRSQLVGLSNEIPLSFQQLSGIATLGNQLGIEAQNIEGFTGTVARFSAVSGVAFEETAKSFGSMSEILGVAEADYERLGSSIALVGRRSVATEGEILSLTREIGQQASQAGFSADEVIGLAGALGELRVPPERARGSLTTYFQTLTQAVAEGGDRLEDFASVVGMSTGELSAAVREGRGLEVFQRFLTALSQTDTVTAAAALDRLGLAQLRVSDVFQRLGSNTDVFNQSLANGRQGWVEGTELARQYALVLDDLSTRWQLFLNALMTFGAAVGDQVAPAFLALLDGGSRVLQILTAFVQSPVGEWAVQLVGTLLTLVATYAALRGGIALATAALLALRTATSILGGAGLLGGISGLAASLGLVKTSADGARVAAFSLRGALLAVGRATLIIGALQLATELIFNFGESMKVAQQPLHFFTDGVLVAIRALLTLTNAVANALSGLPLIGQLFRDASKGGKILEANWDTLSSMVHSGVDEWVDGLQSVNGATRETGSASAAAFPDVEQFSSGIGDLGNNAGEAAKEVRTLVDYAGDLSGVMSRAFDIRFGSGQAFDDITSSWSAIGKAIEDTNAELTQYQNEMARLSSDRDIREYWLRVAENYGDALRAGQLRAEIADIDADLAKNSKSLTKAQEKNSKSLVGNSDSAVENRAKILGLVQGYQTYIEKLASAGVPQAELEAEANRLRQEFISQATQLGYNSEELETYARGFDDVRIAIQGVPRNITVSADVNPARQALTEFLAEAASARANIQIGGGGGGYGLGQGFGNDFRTGFQDYMRRQPIAVDGYLVQGQQVYRVPGTSLQMYRSGTPWTGSGSPDGVAGVVHNRERVLNERGSRMVSGQFVNAANQGRNPWQYAPKAASSAARLPSSMMVELSPIDRELIAAGKPVMVTIAASDVVKSTGASNEDDNRRGGA